MALDAQDTLGRAWAIWTLCNSCYGARTTRRFAQSRWPVADLMKLLEGGHKAARATETQSGVTLEWLMRARTQELRVKQQAAGWQLKAQEVRLAGPRQRRVQAFPQAKFNH